MRRIGAWMMALLLCVVGTGCGRQLGSPISYEDFTGTYPVEGYVPSQEDLGRAPYSYAGAGPHFSVVLNVRQASEAERSVLIQGKWASAETMAQSGADFPERSEEYNALALKATEEAMALEEAEQIYLTELLVTHNGTEAEQFRYSVSDGGTLYLSGYAAGGEVWCRLANTPDGSYTEGLLLPFRQQYSMEICYGEEREEIALTPKEYDLLVYMAQNKNIALTREMLITNVWGYDFYGDDRTLDTHIKLLRRSLGPYSKFIVTLRGVGYRFEGK